MGGEYRAELPRTGLIQDEFGLIQCGSSVIQRAALKIDL